MVQKIVITGYNKTADAPVTEEEVQDAMLDLDLSEVNIVIRELDDEEYEDEA